MAARRYEVKGSPAASATYYCFDHRATMAAILDMRKYPPHCPRPSTNSPIHPRADSTLQPAAPPRPAFHDSTSLPHGVTPLLSCLPACLPSYLPPPRPYEAGPTSIYEQRGSLFFLSHFFSFAYFIVNYFLSSLILFTMSNIPRQISLDKYAKYFKKAGSRPLLERISDCLTKGIFSIALSIRNSRDTFQKHFQRLGG